MKARYTRTAVRTKDNDHNAVKLGNLPLLKINEDIMANQPRIATGRIEEFQFTDRSKITQAGQRNRKNHTSFNPKRRINKSLLNTTGNPLINLRENTDPFDMTNSLFVQSKQIDLDPDKKPALVLIEKDKVDKIMEEARVIKKEN